MHVQENKKNPQSIIDFYHAKQLFAINFNFFVLRNIFPLKNQCDLHPIWVVLPYIF